MCYKYPRKKIKRTRGAYLYKDIQCFLRSHMSDILDINIISKRTLTNRFCKMFMKYNKNILLLNYIARKNSYVSLPNNLTQHIENNMLPLNKYICHLFVEFVLEFRGLASCIVGFGISISLWEDTWNFGLLKLKLLLHLFSFARDQRISVAVFS